MRERGLEQLLRGAEDREGESADGRYQDLTQTRMIYPL